MKKLKPCPFCGKGPYVVKSFYNDSKLAGYQITHGCGLFPDQLQSWRYATKQEAISAWNRRSTDGTN